MPFTKDDFEQICLALHGSFRRGRSQIATDLGLSKQAVHKWGNKNLPSADHLSQMIEWMAELECKRAVQFVGAMSGKRVKRLDVLVFPDGEDVKEKTGIKFSPHIHRRIMTRAVELMRKEGINAVAVEEKV